MFKAVPCRTDEVERAPRNRKRKAHPGQELVFDAEGITEDFSLSGVKLRLPAGSEEVLASLLTLGIMLPSSSLDVFQSQQPLRVDARVVRPSKEAGNAVLGLEFQNLTRDQKQRLEASFGHLNKEARYRTS